MMLLYIRSKFIAEGYEVHVILTCHNLLLKYFCIHSKVVLKL